MCQNKCQDIYEIKAQLIKVYEKWIEEVSKQYPQFLLDNYSNPYYAGIQDNWCNGKIRILIVGEEGYFSNNSGNGKLPISSHGVYYDKVECDDIDELMEWSKECLNVQLIDGYAGIYGYKKIDSLFWKWFREVKKVFPDAVFAWTELDKICKKNTGSGCSLQVGEQTKLHSVTTKILNEEIEILQPDIIIFLGWYNRSLKLELPQIFDQLEDKRSNWKIEKSEKFYYKEKLILFSYHPSWMERNNKSDKNYFEKFINILKEIQVNTR